MRVQEVLRRRYQRPGEKGKLRFLMRGVAVCADCGHLMTAERHRRWAYYRCIANAVGQRCDGRASNAGDAHRSLQHLYESLAISDELKRRVRDAGETEITRRVESVRKRLKPAQQRIERLLEQEVKLTETFAAGDMPVRVYKTVLEKTRCEIMAAHAIVAESGLSPEQMLANLDAVLTVASTLRHLHDRFDLMGQQELLRLLFKEITLDRGQIVAYTLNAPFDVLLAVCRRPPERGQRNRRAQFEDTYLAPAIKYIFEFDATSVRRILDNREKAA